MRSPHSGRGSRPVGMRGTHECVHGHRNENEHRRLDDEGEPAEDVDDLGIKPLFSDHQNRHHDQRTEDEVQHYVESEHRHHPCSRINEIEEGETTVEQQRPKDDGGHGLFASESVFFVVVHQVTKQQETGKFRKDATEQGQHVRRRDDRGVNAELCVPVIVVNAAHTDGEHPEQNHPNRTGCNEPEDVHTRRVLARPVVSRVDDEVGQGEHHANGEAAEDHHVRWGQHSVPAHVQMPLQIGGEADSSNQMVEREKDAKEIDEFWSIHHSPSISTRTPCRFCP